MKSFVVLLLAAVLGLADTPAITEVHAFPVGADGRSFPEGATPGPIIQASDGNFYGVTQSGGDDGSGCQPHACGGTVFKITPAGEFSVLHTFVWGSAAAPYADGAHPLGLVEGPDGFLYGLTFAGGNATSNDPISGYGVVYRISTSGAFKNLHKFCFDGACEEGHRPEGVLTLGRDGKFYGTTISSGSNHASSKGTVFRVSTSGVVETLHNLDGFNDGGAPTAGVVQASDGNFYGTTSGGGSTQFAVGTVYRVTPAGDFSTVYTFQLGPPNPTKDGQAPKQALVQACHGKLYGVTSLGGVNQRGTLFEIGLDGQYKTLFDLQTPQMLLGPNALLLATDGNLWGSSQVGTEVYAISRTGSVAKTVPYLKLCGPNGPQAPLIQASDGKLFGTLPLCGTINGVPGAQGSVFSIDAGLPPPPLPVIAAVTNGASFSGGGIVPGEIATLFGSVLTSATGINLASGLPLSTHLLDVDVYVNEIPAPIFAVDNVNGQQQINFQVPWEVAGQSTVTIRVENNCHSSVRLVVPVLAAQPGIISYNVGGINYGAILHADFQLADSAHPAKAGETVLIYCTGLGAVSAAPADGEAANGETTVESATATVGGIDAPVSFSGLAPGFVGLNQVNLVIPPGLASGNQPVVLNIHGVAGNSVQLPVH